MDFTHLNDSGEAVMVDISDKEITKRTATAVGTIRLSKECFEKVKEGSVKKGDVLAVARVAGIMAAKNTSTLIPLCHILPLTGVEIEFRLLEDRFAIEACCKVKTVGKTGVEMEALTGVNVALLTIYDMCKAISKDMVMEQIHLLEKHGGKSGDYFYEGSV